MQIDLYTSIYGTFKFHFILVVHCPSYAETQWNTCKKKCSTDSTLNFTTSITTAAVVKQLPWHSQASHTENIPLSAGATDETTDIIFGGGDLEPDFSGNEDCRSLRGGKSDRRPARDLDLERDLELHCDLNLDLIGERDRERRGMSLERRL